MIKSIDSIVVDNHFFFRSHSLHFARNASIALCNILTCNFSTVSLCLSLSHTLFFIVWALNTVWAYTRINWKMKPLHEIVCAPSVQCLSMCAWIGSESAILSHIMMLWPGLANNKLETTIECYFRYCVRSMEYSNIQMHTNKTPHMPISLEFHNEIREWERAGAHKKLCNEKIRKGHIRILSFLFVTHQWCRCCWFPTLCFYYRCLHFS